MCAVWSTSVLVFSFLINFFTVLPCSHDLCQSCQGWAHSETIFSPEATLQLYSGVDNTIVRQPYDAYRLHKQTRDCPCGNTKELFQRESVQRISFLNNWFGCMNKPREETAEHTNLQLDSKRLWVWHSFSQTRGNPLHNSWHFQTKGRIILRGNISNATSKKSSVCLEQGGRVSGGRSVAGQYKLLYLLTPTKQVFTKISGTVLANCKKKVFCLHPVSRSIYQKNKKIKNRWT